MQGKTHVMLYVRKKLESEEGKISEEEFDEMLKKLNEKRDDQIFIIT